MKECTHCHQLLNLDNFRKVKPYKGTKERLTSWCIPCLRALSKEGQEKNKVKYKAQRLRKRAENPERTRQQRRIEYQRYRAKILVDKQRYYKRNLQRITAYKREHNKHDRSGAKARGHRREARKRGNGGAFTAAEWDGVKHQYNYTCLRCGKREPEIILTADHVIPLVKGGTSYITNIQPLCRPCNSAKGDKHIDYRTLPISYQYSFLDEL